MSCTSLSDAFPHALWPGLSAEFAQPYMQCLCRFLEHERAEWPTDVHPDPECVFEAFRLTPWDDVRVVILGQDPYPEQGQATGLAFSVHPGAPLTQSLRKIEDELRVSLGCQLKSGDLKCWAQQGVLLLNTVLTVFGPGGSLSHRGRGWECFADVVIQKLLAGHPNPLAFLLWGKEAQAKGTRLGISTTRHKSVPAPHPAWVHRRNQRGFVGSNVFKTADAFLGSRRINWGCT